MNIVKTASLLVAGLWVGTAHADLIVNGNFSAGDFTGWTQFGNTGFTGVSDNFSGVTPVGGSAYEAYFGPVGSIGGISQTLGVTTGQTYDINFWLANFGGTPSEFQVTWGGAVVLDMVNPDGFGYTDYDLQVIASGPSVDIGFGFQQNPSYFLLDNVSVTPVPEPATVISGMALLLPLGAGVARQLRKKLQAA